MPIYSVDVEITVRIEKQVIADSEEIAKVRGENLKSRQKNALLSVLDARKHLQDPKVHANSVREFNYRRAEGATS